MKLTPTTRSIITSALCAVVVLALAAAPASAETRSFSSDRLEVRNLIGEVRVESHRGSSFEVDVQARGAGGGRQSLELDASDELLNIRFPDAGDFVYPALGRSSSSISGGNSDWLADVGVTGRVKVEGAGRGLELWADVVIRVPRGGELKVRHAVGNLIVEDVDADLELSTHDGDVSVRSTRGELQVATGSGAVDIETVEGDKAQIATGSGDIKVRDSRSVRLQVATGSGDVEVDQLDGERLQIATGSGSVTAREIAADEANFATGSGDVTANLDRLGRGEFSFGTGSGDIVLTLPRGASAEVHAETDKGEIDVALTAATRFAVREEDEVRLTVGDGDARVNLGTGSGDIRIRD